MIEALRDRIIERRGMARANQREQSFNASLCGDSLEFFLRSRLERRPTKIAHSVARRLLRDRIYYSGPSLSVAVRFRKTLDHGDTSLRRIFFDRDVALDASTAKDFFYSSGENCLGIVKAAAV